MPSAESFRGVGYRAGDVGEQIQWGIPQALSTAHWFPGATGCARHAGRAGMCLLTVGGEHGPLVESRAGVSGRLWAEPRLSLYPDATPASKASKSSEGLPDGTRHTVPSKP